jgi:multidrug transporter EmrE-like cation transporter
LRAEFAGAAVAVVAAILYDLGYVLEKQGLDGLPPLGLDPASLLRAVMRSKRWLAGFIAMLGGLALQVIALTMAPVSVVQPILAGGLIALAAAGSSVLGERLNRKDTIALVLVLVAVVATAVSAHGGTALARAVPGLRFALLAVPVAGLGSLAGFVGVGGPGSAPERRVGSERKLVWLAAGAGLLYGLGAVAEKAIATRLVSRGIFEGTVSAMASPYPWLFVVATLAGMLVFQVGLQSFPASLMASLTNAVSTVCALTGAAVVFSEGLLPGGWWLPARLVGFAAVLGAVAVLAGAWGSKPEDGRVADRAVAG